MGVGSLIIECDQLGIPFDISKLTRESVGLTVDQVLELRLEQLILARKLEMSEERRTVEALDFKNQLEQVSKENEDEIASQREEIKNLKGKIEKIKEGLEGAPGVLMEKSAEEADDDGDFETIDWAADKMDSVTGREDGNGTSKQTGSTMTLEEESAREHESQENDDDDGVMANESTSGSADLDLHSFKPRSMSVCSVTSSRDDYEDSGVQKTQGIDEKEKDDDSSSKSDDEILVPESQGNPRKENGSREDTILESEASSPAYHPRANRRPSNLQEELDTNSDISSPPGCQTKSGESGSPKAKTIRTYESSCCPRCPKQFKSKWKLNCHLFVVHSNDSELFKCERCCVAYISEDDLKRHSVQCRLKNRGSLHFNCRYCSKLFNCKTTCDRHEGIHLRNRKGRARCKICHTTYSRIEGLRRHNKMCHSHEDSGIQKTLEIDENDEDSSSKSDDEIVVPESQGNPRNEGGSRDDTILQSLASVSAYHLRPNRPIIRQEELDNTSSTLSSPGCESKSDESGSLQAKTTTPYKFCRRCPRCSKLVKDKWSLNCHLFSAHSSDPKLFKCERCSLAYFSEDELKRHNVRCQLKNRESSCLKCRVCSKVFKTVKICSRHQRVHLLRNGEIERVKCEICHQSFSRIDCLRKHKTRFHSRMK